MEEKIPDTVADPAGRSIRGTIRERTGDAITYHAEMRMTFEDFVRRRTFYDERLLTIEPIIDRFCAARGYLRDNNAGQYPRRSLRRVGEVERYAEVALG